MVEESMDFNPTTSLKSDEQTYLISLLKRIALKDGAYDDFLDSSSCTTLQFPFEVLVDGEKRDMKSQEDVLELEELYQTALVKKLELIFPLWLTFDDYTNDLVNSKSELAYLANSCNSERYITCIDLQYPVAFSVYDPENQVSNVDELHNDEELYHYFKDFKSGNLLSVQYPVYLILSDGSEVEIYNNVVLFNTINEYKNACIREPQEEFKEILKAHEWSISHFSAPLDSTALFEAYTFSFEQEDEVKAQKDDETVKGEWEVNEKDEKPELELEFEDETFDALNEDWQVLAFSEFRIEMQNKPKTGEGVKVLILENVNK
jgi:hypothetical protein